MLAGGAARRLGGVDKPMIEVDGRALLHRVVGSLVSAEPVVVVGPRRAGLPEVVWTREEPPGSGPVAALAAGLALVPNEYVAVLAADLPRITAATVERLTVAAAEAPGAAGAVLVDHAGYRQWLIGVWRSAVLRSALPSDPTGASLRGALGGLPVVEILSLPGETDDVDTPEDLERA